MKLKHVSHVLIALGAVLLVLGAWQAAGLAKGPQPKTVTIDNKNGTVTFNHEKHVKDLKVTCKTCHHKMDSDKDKMACRDCHKAEKVGESPAMKDAAHGKCKKCHEEKKKADAGTKAPTACKDCHKK